MRIKFNKFFANRFKTKVDDQSNKNDPKSDTKLWRNVTTYWLLGLTTEFGYVLIICAAHDILQTFGTDTNVIYLFSHLFVQFFD